MLMHTRLSLPSDAASGAIRERSAAAAPAAAAALQAMELDEAQRDASDVFALRQQLASAQQAEAHLRQQLAHMRQQVAASAGGSTGSGADAGAGDDLSPRGSVHSGGSSCSSPARLGGGARASLSGRLDVASRELVAARQEVRLGGQGRAVLTWLSTASKMHCNQPCPPRIVAPTSRLLPGQPPVPFLPSCTP